MYQAIKAKTVEKVRQQQEGQDLKKDKSEVNREQTNRQRRNEVLRLAQNQLRSDLSWIIIIQKINRLAYFSK